MQRFLGFFLLLVFGPVGTAFGQDLPPPATPDAPRSSTPRHIAVDGSGTSSSLGDHSFDLSTTLAPGDINEAGLRIRLTGSGSWYRFITNSDPLTFGSGNSLEGSVLAGYQFSLGRASFIALAGPSLVESHDEGVRSARIGLKATGSFYARPTDLTMAYGSVSYTTIANFLQVQSKVGVKVFGDVYVGPEASFSWRNVIPAYDNVGLMRIGAHISALSFGPALIGVSGGWAQQKDLGHGYYGGVNFFVTF